MYIKQNNRMQRVGFTNIQEFEHFSNPRRPMSFPPRKFNNLGLGPQPSAVDQTWQPLHIILLKNYYHYL